MTSTQAAGEEVGDAEGAPSSLTSAGSTALAPIIGRSFQLALGTVVGQGVVVLATPYLARQYTPAAFGELAVLMTVCNIAVAAACLRYDLAIPGAPEREVRGFTIAAMAGVCVSAVLVTAAIRLVGHLHPASALSVASSFGWLLPLCVLLAGLYQLTTVCLLRRGSYMALAATRASQGIIFCALATSRTVGLLWAQVMSYLAGVYALRAAGEGRTQNEVQQNWTAVAQRHWRIPALSLPGALLDVVAFSLCVWILTGRYGASAAGNYAQVQRLVGAPLMLASMSLGQIILKRTGELNDDIHAIRRMVWRIGALLLAGSALLVALVALVGEPALRLILGSQWRVDSLFVMEVVAAVAARSCVSPLSAALFPIRRYDVALVWQIIYFCSASLVLGFLTRSLAFEQFMMVYALHELALYSLYFGLIVTARPHATGAPSLSLPSINSLDGSMT